MNRHDTIWERPSWPFGAAKTKPKKRSQQQTFHTFHDHFNILDETPYNAASPSNMLPPAVQTALLHMGLVWPVTADDLKQTYKSLVKKLHPDVNPGLQNHVERFKQVTTAYQTLKKFLHL